MDGLLKQIKNLKKFGIVAIKQSLEDEGANFNEVIFAKKISKKNNLKLNVKIGGCEAKNDIFFCYSVPTDSIVAPMVESEYALKKFIQTVPSSYKGDLYINLETKNAFLNLDKIIKSKDFTKLKGVVIGRSDIAGSLSLSKSKVDSYLIFNLLKKNLHKIKKNKKIIKMGGSITQKSKNFIEKLYKQKLIDRVETRNVELELSEKLLDNFDAVVPLIFEFEIEWLKFKNKNLKLNNISKKINISRILEMKNRMKKK